MEIRPLDREIYAGKTFTACYRTNGYYEICPSETGFQMDYVPFAEPTERSFDDVFFGEWLEDPIAFGAFEGEKLIGYVEGSIEGWNNRFRLSNICVLDFSERSRGVGTALMKPIERAAEDAGAYYHPAANGEIDRRTGGVSSKIQLVSLQENIRLAASLA